MSTITTPDTATELQQLTELLAELQAQLDQARDLLARVAALNATPIQD